MKMLLDTHMLLWAAADQLPPEAEKIVLDESYDLYFSSASIWEVSIKNKLGRADFNVDVVKLVNGLVKSGYKEMPISTRHALQTNHLEEHHKDPFDRILVAQSIVENIHLLTSDAQVAQYRGPIIHIKK